MNRDTAHMVAEAVLQSCKRAVSKNRSLDNLNLSAIIDGVIQASANPPGQNIDGMLQLSTAHIQRATSVALGEASRKITEAALWNTLSYTSWNDWGWIIFCSPDAVAAVEHEYPELANLLKFALDNGCEFLRLDADAPQVDLPVFDWEAEAQPSAAVEFTQ